MSFSCTHFNRKIQVDLGFVKKRCSDYCNSKVYEVVFTCLYKITWNSTDF